MEPLYLPKVITIVGPTTTGKSSLAVEVALAFSGEVISADSRQVYKGLDIGSAKITEREMCGIPHHLLSITDPLHSTYTAADFTRDARQAISDIAARGHLPIITGGTFFYIDNVLGSTLPAPVAPDPALRAALAQKSLPELYDTLLALDEERAAAIDHHNPHRLIRAIEIATVLGKNPAPTVTQPLYNTLKIGISITNELLIERITTRLDERLSHGLCEEIESLLERGVPEAKLIGFGLEYRYITDYLKGRLTLDAARTLLIIKTRQFAKRQMTWLKRDKDILWYPAPLTLNEIRPQITSFLEMK